MKLSTKRLCILSILLALNVALEAVSIRITGSLQIKFTFIITMFVATSFTLPECIAFAIAQDILAYILVDSMAYSFNPGYTIQAVITIILYYLFLHKKQNLFNIAIVKLIVNIFINVGFGSILSMIDYKTFTLPAYVAFISEKIFKNIIMWPIEVLIFFIIFPYLSKLTNKYLK